MSADAGPSSAPPPAAVAPADEARRVRLYALACLALVALSGYHTTLPIFRGALQEYFELTMPQFARLLSAGLIPSAVASLAAGMAIARWGTRPVLRAALLASALGMALAAGGWHWAMMAAALAVAAAAYNALHVVSQPYLTGLFPTRPRQVIALLMSMSSFAGLLAPLWAEGLLAWSRRFEAVRFAHVLHAPFLAVALLMLAGAALFGRRSPASAAAASVTPPPALAWWRRLAVSRGSLPLMAILILMGASDTALSLWAPRVLDSATFEDFSAVVKPGYVMAAFNFSFIWTRWLLSALPDRLGRRLLIAAPALLGGAALLAGVLSQRGGWLAAGIVGGAALWSAQVPATLAALGLREGPRFGWAVALFMVGSSAGAFVLTNAMGAWASHLGEERLWLMLVVPCAGHLTAGTMALTWVLLARPASASSA